MARKLITFQGQTMTVAAWCRKFNIKAAKVYKRLKDGMSFQDALYAPHYRVEKIQVGQEAHSVKEWAKICEVSQEAIYSRRSRGFNKRDLVVGSMVQYTLTAFGRTQKIIEWSRETGYTSSMIICRLKRGWTPERAVSDPPVRRNETRYPKIKAFGQEKSIPEWSLIYNVPAETIRSRINRSGWKPEKAIKTPSPIRKKRSCLT